MVRVSNVSLVLFFMAINFFKQGVVINKVEYNIKTMTMKNIQGSICELYRVPVLAKEQPAVPTAQAECKFIYALKEKHHSVLATNHICPLYSCI